MENENRGLCFIRSVSVIWKLTNELIKTYQAPWQVSPVSVLTAAACSCLGSILWRPWPRRTRSRGRRWPACWSCPRDPSRGRWRGRPRLLAWSRRTVRRRWRSGLLTCRIPDPWDLKTIQKLTCKVVSLNPSTLILKWKPLWKVTKC